MTKKKLTYLFGLIAGAIVIVFLYLAIARPPVAVRIRDLDSVRGNPAVLVLNPFRDRAPEAAAEEFLEKLRDGRCAEAVAGFPADRSEYICRKQAEYPLLSWQLIDLEPDGSGVRISYRHNSRNSSEEMSVFLGKTGPNWKVTGFAIGY
ncbi:MAG: hypothetical protein JSS81_03470 [Acidobacteria bacterium]|nr:hypothetical protein [Acidobacteriota bacterium]